MVRKLPGGASGKEPACQCRRHKRRVQSLGQEDPLEEGMATYFCILAWRITRTEKAWRATVHGATELDTTEVTEHTHKETASNELS